MFEQLTIIGPGLLGASLGMAAKARGLAHRVGIWSRRQETREECLRETWCDAAYDTPEAAAREADAVVLCTPVATIIPLLQRIAPELREDALVTDVGSTKAHICNEAAATLRGPTRFIGSHPMAGSERTGKNHARPDLFEGAACLITPLAPSPAVASERLRKFWEAIGMRVTEMSPEEHDAIVARISHLPHLLASALCHDLSNKDPKWPLLAGGGLRDSTRIAAGDPSLWSQILSENRSEILHALNAFENTLRSCRAALQNNDTATVEAFLRQARDFRRKLDEPVT
ncbi:MAG: prephenate dehydrogenase [Opitutales bacterium]